MKFVAKRIRFRNGERHSLLSVQHGCPVHQATLFLSGFRKKGRAANTIHFVCCTLALVHQELFKANIDLLERIQEGRFLTMPEVNRLADAAQYRAADLSYQEGQSNPKVVDMRRLRPRRKANLSETRPAGAATQASRLRYTAHYFEFLVGYFKPALSYRQQETLERESTQALDALRAQIPPVSRRARLNARQGVSREEQERLVALVRPGSPTNPWVRGFVQHRNFVIVVLLLATGMRRGGLLGLQIGDLTPATSKLKVVRRADAREDSRTVQPNTKTNDRELELRPAIMRLVWGYIAERKKIRAARKHPHVIVADDGKPLSLKSIDKLFAQIRKACPDIAVQLSSHVLRHTWNDRFSEAAELMGLSDVREEKARNEQQGWADGSKSAQTYTRRYAARKGRELSLKLQEKLDVSQS